MSNNKQESRIKLLIARGKEQGYLTYADVNDHLPQDISDPDQVEDIIQMINDMGIRVYENAPDAEELLMTDGDSSADEIASAEAAAALAAVETEAGRTTDPVRMYMREMGTVELLTREGEIAIAKRIEEGTRDLMHALACWPGVVHALIDEFDLLTKEERRIPDLIAGWLDPADDVPAAGPSAQKNKADKDKNDDDEDEVDTGLDPIEVNERFGSLKKQLAKTDKVIKKHGRESKEAEAELSVLGDIIKFFKLPPRQFDPMYKKARGVLESVRKEERRILALCVRTAKMPRKTFIKEFPGNETDPTWIPGVIEKKRDYSANIDEVKEEILRAQRKLKHIQTTVGIELSMIKEINRRM
jgi:RNA polymerase primary sigma factor